MTQIFATTFAPTLPNLIDEIVKAARPGQLIEAWLFNDAQTRAAAEAKLAQQGIKARIRSSYKPLLHFFLEDIDLAKSGIANITVRYPRHQNAADNRFLLETYPLAALVTPALITFEASDRCDCTYDVILRGSDGVETRHEVLRQTGCIRMWLMKPTCRRPAGCGLSMPMVRLSAMNGLKPNMRRFLPKPWRPLPIMTGAIRNLISKN